MGAFSKKTFLQGNPSLIPAIADRLTQSFAAEGYKTKRDNLVSGGEEVFVTKGGFFKEILGMRTALKITLIPQNELISFEAGIGIFGQQFIPTVITWLVAWPVMITQIWGLVQQAKLDDMALEIANSVIDENSGACFPYEPTETNKKFCTNCGTCVATSAKFCPNCGTQLPI